MKQVINGVLYDTKLDEFLFENREFDNTQCFYYQHRRTGTRYVWIKQFNDNNALILKSMKIVDDNYFNELEIAGNHHIAKTLFPQYFREENKKCCTCTFMLPK